MAPQVQATLTSLGSDVSIPDEAHYPTRFDALQAIVDRTQPQERPPITRFVPVAAAP